MVLPLSVVHRSDKWRVGIRKTACMIFLGGWAAVWPTKFILGRAVSGPEISASHRDSRSVEPIYAL